MNTYFLIMATLAATLSLLGGGGKVAEIENENWRKAATALLLLAAIGVGFVSGFQINQERDSPSSNSVQQAAE